jgi:hypothetical protein
VIRDHKAPRDLLARRDLPVKLDLLALKEIRARRGLQASAYAISRNCKAEVEKY